MIGWTIAATAMGVSFAALTHEVSQSLGSLNDPLVTAALGGDPSRILQGYLAVCVLFNVILASCFAIIHMQRLGTGEREGRAEVMLALPLGRVRYALTSALVTLCGVVVILTVSGVASGLAAAGSTGTSEYIGQLTIASLAFIPAVGVCLATAFLGLALSPGLPAIGWVVMGVSGFLSMLAGPLQLPKGVVNLSVFHAVGQLPLDTVRPWPLVILGVITVILIALGLTRYRQRDI